HFLEKLECRTSFQGLSIASLSYFDICKPRNEHSKIAGKKEERIWIWR
ncbi:MAG: hypothetical protein ACI90V_002921, partial [Bacillariaceae sp.]